MPGHMNVLLAEAGVPYEVLKEDARGEPGFESADVALVVGANDVVNFGRQDDARCADLWHADPRGR
jgi:NAD(P) transhydrogenase subunit beta